METINAVIGQGGRVVIPAALRAQFGISEGDTVVLSSDATGIHITTPQQAIAALQAIAERRIKPLHGEAIVESFIAERREEARRES